MKRNAAARSGRGDAPAVTRSVDKNPCHLEHGQDAEHVRAPAPRGVARDAATRASRSTLRMLEPSVTANPPLVTIAATAAIQTMSAAVRCVSPRLGATLTFAAAHTPAVVIPLSPHSERKIVVNAINGAVENSRILLLRCSYVGLAPHRDRDADEAHRGQPATSQGGRSLPIVAPTATATAILAMNASAHPGDDGRPSEIASPARPTCTTVCRRRSRRRRRRCTR